MAIAEMSHHDTPTGRVDGISNRLTPSLLPCFFVGSRIHPEVGSAGLSGGVMVAQGPLEAFVMVQIHAGQPVLGSSLPPKESIRRDESKCPRKPLCVPKRGVSPLPSSSEHRWAFLGQTPGI